MIDFFLKGYNVTLHLCIGLPVKLFFFNLRKMLVFSTEV